jgi:hypothetical protein
VQICQRRTSTTLSAQAHSGEHDHGEVEQSWHSGWVWATMFSSNFYVVVMMENDLKERLCFAKLRL